MLSLLRFLLHLSAFCGTTPRCTSLYSDNLALIQRICKQLVRRHWYPNDTISSEWDVLQSITQTLHQFAVLPHITHVKGPQDSLLAYDRLPLEAQLNVDADAAAALYQETHGASQYIVPQINGTGAHLLIGDKTVTYNYVQTL